MSGSLENGTDKSTIIPAGVPRTTPDVMRDIKTAFPIFCETMEKSVKVCMPAIVTEYDRCAHEATVMPLIKSATRANGKTDYVKKRTVKVRVRQINHGGFLVDIPLFQGDTGWVISADEDTTNLKDSLATLLRMEDVGADRIEDEFAVTPHTLMARIFEHGFFVPDFWGQMAFSQSAKSFVGDGDLYIGTSNRKFRADDSESGELPMACIVLSQSGQVTLASQKESGGNSATITLDGGKISLGCGGDASLTIEDGQITIHASKVNCQGCCGVCSKPAP